MIIAFQLTERRRLSEFLVLFEIGPTRSDRWSGDEAPKFITENYIQKPSIIIIFRSSHNEANPGTKKKELVARLVEISFTSE